MANLRPFQIIMLAVFAIFAVLSVILLSGYSPSGSDEAAQYGERVVIWGPFSADAFDTMIGEIADSDEGFEVVEYYQIDRRTFNETFVNAVADGRSPDLIILPSSELVRQRSRLLALSYETITLRDFKDTNADGADIFARPDGVYAIPFAVDPMVMYWNRDIIASNGLATAPSTWEEIVSRTVPSVVRRDNNRNVLQAALAFGEVRNVQNAKEMLLLLAMQSGSQMVTEDRGSYQVELNSSLSNTGLPPLEAAVQFYSGFSNANSQLYTWNRSQPLDRNVFVSGDLALYFGYASELAVLEAQNPNLNFDMAPMPQGASATVRRTFGEWYGFAIPKASANAQGAFLVANVLARPDVATALSESLGIAPAQRAALAAGSGDAFRQIVLTSALTARGWLDPNTTATDGIMQAMVEDVASNRESLSTAVTDAERKIGFEF